MDVLNNLLSKHALNCVAYTAILNVVLSLVATKFATADELSPPEGAANLSLKSQLVNMLVHHKEVLVSSSILVCVLCILACKLCELYPLF